MDYIKEVNFKLQLVINHQMVWIDKPFVTYVNQCLLPYLTTLDVQRKLLRRIYGFKNKVPIILNPKCILICVQSYRSKQALYLNYYQIESWKRNGQKVIVRFNHGHSIYLNSYCVFINQIRKIEHIINHKLRIKII